MPRATLRWQWHSACHTAMETGYCQRQTHFGHGMRDLGERNEQWNWVGKSTFKLVDAQVPRCPITRALKSLNQNWLPHCHMGTVTVVYRPCIIKSSNDTMKNQALASIINIKNPEACFGKKKSFSGMPVKLFKLPGFSLIHYCPPPNSPSDASSFFWSASRARSYRKISKKSAKKPIKESAKINTKNHKNANVSTSYFFPIASFLF
jgi:hypothetical protein